MQGGRVFWDGANNPLDGAVVQLKDAKDADDTLVHYPGDHGKYHFNGLSKDVDYELTASFKGKIKLLQNAQFVDGRKQPVMDLIIEK